MTQPTQVADYVRTQVQGLRVDHPDTCWRPSPDWQRVCILDIGHGGDCGWQFTNGKRMGWERQIDGGDGHGK